MFGGVVKTHYQESSQTVIITDGKMCNVQLAETSGVNNVLLQPNPKNSQHFFFYNSALIITLCI